MDMKSLAKNSEHPKQSFSIFSRNCINVACCHPLIGNPPQKQNDDATMTLPDVRSCLYAQTHVQVVVVMENDISEIHTGIIKAAFYNVTLTIHF